MKLISLFVILTVFMLVMTASAMPPHPRVIEMINRGEIDKPIFMQNPDFFAEKGINQGKPNRLAALDQPTGQFKALAILVKFTDKNNQTAASYFDNLIYGVSGSTVRNFYSAASRGSLDIVTVNLPSALGWRTMPQTYAYYVDGNYGFGSYPHNAQKLAEDAVWAVNSSVDFSQYDNDGDGTVDALFIIHAGRGAEYSGSVNDIWSHAWECQVDPYVDGVWVNGYSMEPEYWSSPGDMTCGVYAHELGHVFGLPDFYDYDYDSRGLGDWSLMAGGSWNGSNGNSPAFPDAYSRVFLGFATVVNVTTNSTGVQIPAVADSGIVYRLWTNGASGSQYFLAENRRQISYDAALPSQGLLIYHVDNTVSGNNNQWYPGYTDNGHYQVALEQADGDWDLEQDINSGDNGDPYPGSSINRTFNYNSTPNSRSYTDANTYVAITNISNSASIMTADLSVSNAPSAPAQIAPQNGSYTSNRRPTFDFSDVGGATRYHIQIDNNSNFASPEFENSNLTVSQYTPATNMAEVVFYWRVRAFNGTVWSGWSSAWTVGIDATAPGAPTGLLANGANPSPWTSNSTFEITWTNPSDFSGIRRALYRLGSPPTNYFDTTGSMPYSPSSITLGISGVTNLYVWVQDNAGNVNHQNFAMVVLQYDGIRPQNSMAISPDTSASRAFTVSWTRGMDSGGSGLSGRYDIWVKINAEAWFLWLNDVAETTAIFVGDHGDTYRFEALSIDNAGNVEYFSGAGETTTLVDTLAYLPGDANRDGSVRGSDVTYLVGYFKGTNPPPNPILAGDANGDCLVMAGDVTYLVRYFKGLGSAPVRGSCR